LCRLFHDIPFYLRRLFHDNSFSFLPAARGPLHIRQFDLPEPALRTRWGCSSSCASAAARTLRVVGLLALLHERGCRRHLDLSEPALRIRWRCSPSCTSAAAELSFLRPMLVVGFYLCRLLHDIYCRLLHDIYTSFYVDSSMISLSICVDSSDIPSPFCLPPGAHSIIGIHILGNSALASCPRAPRDALKLTVV
jgi:hypothetical protein